MTEVYFMRKKIHLKTSVEKNDMTDKWIQLLIQRIIVEQLDVPYQLKAKLLYQTFIRRNEENKNEEENKKEK